LDYIFGTGNYSGGHRYHAEVILFGFETSENRWFGVLSVYAAITHKYTPGRILTSSKEENDLITGYTLGANSYIRKPVNFNQLSSHRQLAFTGLS